MIKILDILIILIWIILTITDIRHGDWGEAIRGVLIIGLFLLVFGLNRRIQELEDIKQKLITQVLYREVEIVQTGKNSIEIRQKEEKTNDFDFHKK